MMSRNSRVYIAGHTGLVGSALLGLLRRRGYTHCITRTSKELDLTNQRSVDIFFRRTRPEFVFLVAGKTGGIEANRTLPGEFIAKNLMIQTNVIHSAWKYKVKKLLFTGCSCVYPKHCLQPMRESSLLTGPFEETNEAFSTAKLAGLMMCRAYAKQYGVHFITAVLNTVYGENDDMNINTSHFLPAVIQKMHRAKLQNAKEVVLWGTGKPRRELLHADDVARALLLLMQRYNSSDCINIGSGKDETIKRIAFLVKRVVGYKGRIAFDATKPDGMPRKLFDTRRISALGWKPTVPIVEGIQKLYRLIEKE